ncbi:MAG: 2-hydroxymuconate tautomerase family protein [Zavarzinia sp.]|nr:2-hydroxymuconate tautomerase family protein [Zavarzinia sp.]
MPIINITLIAGRAPERKRLLIEKVTDAVETSLEVPRSSIRVIINEVPAEHFAVGGVPKS